MDASTLLLKYPRSPCSRHQSFILCQLPPYLLLAFFASFIQMYNLFISYTTKYLIIYADSLSGNYTEDSGTVTVRKKGSAGEIYDITDIRNKASEVLMLRVVAGTLSFFSMNVFDNFVLPYPPGQ